MIDDALYRPSQDGQAFAHLSKLVSGGKQRLTDNQLCAQCFLVFVMDHRRGWAGNCLPGEGCAPERSRHS